MDLALEVLKCIDRDPELKAAVVRAVNASAEAKEAYAKWRLKDV